MTRPAPVFRLSSIRGPSSIRGTVRRVAVWAALLSLLIQVLGAPALASVLSSESRDGIVICTASGPKTVDSSGQPLKAPVTDHHAVHCLFCLPLMHGAAMAPDLPLQVVRGGMAPPAAWPTAEYGGARVPPRLAGAASPQAPPFS